MKYAVVIMAALVVAAVVADASSVRRNKLRQRTQTKMIPPMFWGELGENCHNQEPCKDDFECVLRVKTWDCSHLPAGVVGADCKPVTEKHGTCAIMTDQEEVHFASGEFHMEIEPEPSADAFVEEESKTEAKMLPPHAWGRIGEFCSNNAPCQDGFECVVKVARYDCSEHPPGWTGAACKPVPEDGGTCGQLSKAEVSVAIAVEEVHHEDSGDDDDDDDNNDDDNNDDNNGDDDDDDDDDDNNDNDNNDDNDDNNGDDDDDDDDDNNDDDNDNNDDDNNDDDNDDKDSKSSKN